MINHELVKRIREYFELNIYETKVWLALLSKGIASAGEIASLSSVPRSRTYDVLESLEKRGFAVVKIGKPVKYIAVKPVEVLEKMKSSVMYEAQEKVKTLANLKETNEYTELEKLHLAGISPINTHEITGSFKGRQNILTKIKELIQNAKKELTLSTSASDFEDKGRVLIPALQQAAKRNIKINFTLSGEPEKIKKMTYKSGLKPSVSNSDTRLFIADKKEVFFMITSDNAEEEIGIWLNSPFFAQSVATMLDTLNSNGNGTAKRGK